jgi:hypothetical protein
MEGLGVGRIVHFVMPEGVVRPAIVIRVWDKNVGDVNLQVFLDGDNDSAEGAPAGVKWASSRLYSESGEVGTWHWPERG